MDLEKTLTDQSFDWLDTLRTIQKRLGDFLKKEDLSPKDFYYITAALKNIHKIAESLGWVEVWRKERDRRLKCKTETE